MIFSLKEIIVSTVQPDNENRMAKKSLGPLNFVKCLKCKDLVCVLTGGKLVHCDCGAIAVDDKPGYVRKGEKNDFRIFHWTEDCS